MKLYQTNPETGEFIKEIEARIDPLESQKEGKKIYLEPKGSVSNPPPKTKDGDVAIYVSGKWTTKQDHRGELWYSKDSKPHVIDFLGDPTEQGFSVDIKKTEDDEITPEQQDFVRNLNIAATMVDVIGKAKDFSEFKKLIQKEIENKKNAN